MGVELAEARRLVEAAAGPDPEAGFAAVVALRGLVEILEELQVDNARAQGWSWRGIARRLGGAQHAVPYNDAVCFPGAGAARPSGRPGRPARCVGWRLAGPGTRP